MKQLFSHDPLTGITREFHHDPMDPEGKFLINTIQDVEPIIEANRESYNAVNTRIGSNGETLTRVASIPLNIYFELQRAGITKDPVAMKRWLNDPDNRAFRTRAGTV